MARRASFDGLIVEIQRRSQRLQDEAASIVADFAHDGERDMEQIIRESITETGIDRVNGNFGSGGNRSPGRVDTGLMINSVNSRSEANGIVFTGEFGWTGGAEPYFLYQENGTAKIAAMHALQGAFVANRERALKRIQDAVRGNA